MPAFAEGPIKNTRVFTRVLMLKYRLCLNMEKICS